MKTNTLVIGGILGFLAVLFGALGAHALKAVISATQLQSFETAVKFQMYHALVILITGILLKKNEIRPLRIATQLFMWGTILFSGSIYCLSTQALTGWSNIGWMGPITPIGGTLLMAGWAFLIAGGIAEKKMKS